MLSAYQVYEIGPRDLDPFNIIVFSPVTIPT